VTPLSDALTAAQRSALAALEKAYVAGQIEREDFAQCLKEVGISDPVDISFLVSALDVLREWGVSAPTMSERLSRGPNGQPMQEFASDSQQQFIRDLCKRKNVPEPDAMGALTKAAASEIIDALNAGTYDPQKWSVPF
jgi:hypothetical protein